MDVLAHTLWTNALFHAKYHRQRSWRYLAALFGVAPDLVGFTPLFVYMIFSGRMFKEQFPFTPTNWTFGFAENAYNYTHSLVIFLTAFVVVLLIGNIWLRLKHPENYRFWFFWPMLGWPLHIFLDIPTHPEFFHTPILFPISGYMYKGGISWANPIFMLVNYSLLISVYVVLIYVQRRKKQAVPTSA